MPQSIRNIAAVQTHSSAAEARLAEIRAMQRRLADLEKETLAEISVNPASPVMAEEWVSLAIAAARFEWCTDTMLAYVKKNRIGLKIGGRWKVDMLRARACRANRPYDDL